MRLSVVFGITWVAYFGLLNVVVNYEEAVNPGTISLSGPLGYELSAPILGIPIIFVALQVARQRKAKSHPGPALTQATTAAPSASLSFYKGVDASYSVDGGRTRVMIKADTALRIKAVYAGTGQMRFWMKPNTLQRGSSWACDMSMVDAVAVEVTEEVADDGRQKIEVDLAKVFPAAFILNRGLLGGLAAPAIRVEPMHGNDIWVFLLRRPWYPLKFQVERSSLSLEHDTAMVNASLGVSADGGLTAQVSLNGTGFKKASLIVMRTLGSAANEEVVGEVQEGTQTFEWTPTTREYDFLLVTKGELSSSELEDVAGGLGANTNRSVIGNGLKDNFVLGDVPAISYSLILRGHSGLLENSQDQTSARFTWSMGA